MQLQETLNVTAYAISGTWSNPLSGEPSILADIVNVTDNNIILNNRTSIRVGMNGPTVIDTSIVDPELPPITHDQFYKYFKALILSKMIES